MTTNVRGLGRVGAQYRAMVNLLRSTRPPAMKAPRAPATEGKSIPRSPIGESRAMQILYERAMGNLLRLAEEADLDIRKPDPLHENVSPEQFVRQFASFGNDFFTVWRQRNTGFTNEQARTEFDRLMGETLEMSLSETRGILDSQDAFEQDLASISGFISTTLDKFSKLSRDPLF